MPAQQTDLLFKANETATLTTSGTLEKQGGIFPLCKAEAPIMRFAQTHMLPISFKKKGLLLDFIKTACYCYVIIMQ